MRFFIASLLAGYALADCPSSQVVNGRQCSVTCGQDRPGGDYAQTKTGSFQACIDACGKDTRCLTAQYHEDNGVCYFKSQVNAAQAASNVDSVVCSAGSTLTTCPARTVTAFNTITTTIIKSNSAAPPSTTTQSITSTVTSTSTTTATQPASTVTATLTPAIVTITAPTQTTSVTVTSTETDTVTTTTTTQDPSPTIAGCNVPDYLGCQEGQLYNPSAGNLYVQACNVSSNGVDIGIGSEGYTATTLNQCADLCEKHQSEGCVGAVFIGNNRGSTTGFSCFLKSSIQPGLRRQGFDLILKLKATA